MTARYNDLGPPFTDQKVSIVRFKADGTYDNSFSQDGQMLIDHLWGTYDSRLLASGGVVLLAPDASDRKLLIKQYKPDGSSAGTVTYQAEQRIEAAFFDTDGKIIVLTKTSTTRLAADGTKIPSSSPGPVIPAN